MDNLRYKKSNCPVLNAPNETDDLPINSMNSRGVNDLFVFLLIAFIHGYTQKNGWLVKNFCFALMFASLVVGINAVIYCPYGMFWSSLTDDC